jgi:CHAT domain-containing protein/tetratricopeptide (TPR) repeat protein
MQPPGRALTLRSPGCAPARALPALLALAGVVVGLGRAGPGSGASQETSTATAQSAPTATPPTANATAASDDIRALLDAGETARAEALARERLAAAERVQGPQSLQAARAIDLVVEAVWRQRKTADPADRALAERALAIKEHALGKDDLELAVSATNLGWLLRVAGEWAGCRAAFERALAIKQRALGVDHPDVAPSLHDRGWIRQQQGEFESAREDYERAIAILERSRDPADPSIVPVLTDLAELHRVTDRLDAALAVIERALRILVDAGEPDSPRLASTLTIQGRVLNSRGDLEAARSSYQRALAIRQKVFGPASSPVADVLNSLGIVTVDLGEYEAGRALLERALEIVRMLHGPDHPRVTATMSNLGIAAYDAGDYTEAIRLWELVLARVQTNLGPQHPRVGDTYNNLGTVHSESGDYGEALRCFERALAIAEATYGSDSPKLGRVLTNLGAALLGTSDLERARTTLERGLALMQGGEGAETTVLARAFDLHGEVLAGLGQLDAARSDLERALALRTSTLGPEHPYVGRSLRSLGNLLARQGDRSGAQANLERAVAVVTASWGPGNPEVGLALQDLARVRLQSGDFEGSLAAALRAEQIGRERLRVMARGLPDRQALRYARVRPAGCAIALAAALAAPRPARIEAAWDALVRSRALVLDEIAARRSLLAASGDSTVAALCAGLQSARARLARLAVREPEAPAQRNADALALALREKERVEREVARHVSALARQAAGDSVGIAAVARALPAGSALVAYARTEAPQSRCGLCALVLRTGPRRMAAVPLGACGRVDSLVADWRAAIAEGVAPEGPAAEQAESACRAAGEQLRRAVWDPLLPHLKGARTVFLVPEGALHLVAFAALPTGDGRYLLETGPLLHVLTTERDLVRPGRFARPAAGWRPATAAGQSADLLAVGGPDFDADPADLVARGPAPVGAVAALALRGARSACDEPAELRFPALPGAALEASTVAGIYRQRVPRADVMVLTGGGATETAFKRAAQGRRVLHLATHGFVLGGACASSLESAVPAWSIASTDELAAGPLVENPLLRAGLALAGANHRGDAGPDRDDGILTGEEIAGLDLSGAEWVVLSACDTGLGEIAAGEGILGLRRAFAVAGARTLIASLWSVDDTDALRWMQELYVERFSRGAPTAEAARAASLAVLRDYRARGQAASPFHWAAFVPTGDWQ